jgi:nickel-dependent lactate racemase
VESFDGKTLLYGRGRIALPQDWSSAPALVPRPPRKKFSLDEELAKALDEPVGSPPLSRLIRPGDSVVVVVSDVTRPSASARVLNAILTRLPARCSLKIFVALGLHRKQTKKELQALLGEEVLKNYPVFQNDTQRADSFVYFGRTSRGTEVELARQILPESVCKRGGRASAKELRVILTGAISAHYFFGFAGGRKSIVPGCASQRTIYQNHLLSFPEDGYQHSACRPGNLKANPCHEDALEAAAMVAPTFLVNTIVGGAGSIVGVVGGDWRKAHEAGCAQLIRNHSVRSRRTSGARPADVVIVGSGGYPRDINFIQVHKAIDHAFRIMKPGGTMVVVGECRDGFGHSTFFRWFGYKDFSEFAHQLRKNYQVYGQTAYATLWKAKKVDILLLSRLKAADVRQMSITPVASLADARARVRAKHGRDYSVRIIPFATDTLILGEQDK